MTEILLKGKFAVPVEQSVVAGDWEGRGYSCGVFIDPPGREWNDFVHSSNELVTVMEGALEMTIEHQRLIVTPGDEVLIPARALHAVKNIHPGTTRWLYGYDDAPAPRGRDKA